MARSKKTRVPKRLSFAELTMLLPDPEFKEEPEPVDSIRKDQETNSGSSSSDLSGERNERCK